MSYDYIKRTYDFVPVVGARVRHTVTGKYGITAREDKSLGHYVMVRFDGQSFRSPCHPMELMSSYSRTVHTIPSWRRQ